MVGNGVGAKNGILFKTAVSQEEAGKVRIVALDKTGTITKGEPVVTDVFPFGDVTEPELLCVAASLEKPSEHPLAQAVVARLHQGVEHPAVVVHTGTATLQTLQKALQCLDRLQLQQSTAGAEAAQTCIQIFCHFSLPPTRPAPRSR
jgi:P-type E1-E2 ATPase